MTQTLPELLLPYQVEALKMSKQSGLFVSEKSRRVGMTYAFAADATLIASAKQQPQNFYYIGYNHDMTRDFIDECAQFTKAFNLVSGGIDGFLFDDGSESGIKSFRIDYPSGGSIIALSSKPRSLRGKKGVVLIDEAAFHDDLDELLKSALALLMWGGRVIVISTHDGADNPFNTLIEDIRSGKRVGQVQRVTLTSALGQGLYRRICLRTGEEWSPSAEAEWERNLRGYYGDAAEEELDVIPARGSGTYLARATILAAMSPDLPVIRIRCPDGFERQADWERTDYILEFLEAGILPLLREMDPRKRTFFGQDFARSGDVSPIMFGQHDPSMKLRASFTIEMRNVPFTEQEFLLGWILERVPLFAHGKMDARGNGAALAEKMQQRFGFDRIEAVQATEKTYLAFMPKLRAAIEDRNIVLPHDEDVLEDLRMIKLVRGIPKIPDRSVTSKADGAKGKRHGDTAIAAMHLVAAADEDPGDIEFASTGTRFGNYGQADVMERSARGFGSVKRQLIPNGF